MRVIIVRHGETVGNVEQRHQGRKDFPLTQRGIEHAKEIAKVFEQYKVAKIYSSDLKRALDTAKIICEETGIPFEPRKELEEISFGILDGLKKETIKQEYDELTKEREKDKIRYRYPEGESYSDVQKRVKPLLKEIKEKHAKETIAFVGHEAVNRTTIGLLLNLGPEKMLEIKQPNDCIYLIEVAEKPKVTHLLLGEQKQEEGVLTR